jgi:hypothetical protein
LSTRPTLVLKKGMRRAVPSSLDAVLCPYVFHKMERRHMLPGACRSPAAPPAVRHVPVGPPGSRRVEPHKNREPAPVPQIPDPRPAHVRLG